jgi:two-component system, OmpR family, sensor kinase
MTWRAGLPRTLRARLISIVVVLLVLGFGTVALVTTLVVRNVLTDRLDAQLHAAGARFAISLEHGDSDHDSGPGQFQVQGQPAGTLGARLFNGNVTSAAVVAAHDSTGAVTAADRAVLARLTSPAGPRTVDLPHLGAYRITVVAGRDGDLQLTGLPYDPVEDTIDHLVLIQALVLALVLVAVAIACAVLVGVNLRPLRRVAATAERVAATPLATGAVTLPERAPPGPPGSEIATLSSAFNAMLDEVGSALSQRHESEERLRRFIADASHELRTPVAVVRSHAEFATRTGGDELPDDVRSALERIVDQTARMGRIVEDLLLLARLDSGRGLQIEDVDLTRIVLDAVDDARVTAPDHRWELRLPEEPVMVRGDVAALHQIVANLLANARVHTPAGTTVRTSLAGSAQVRLEVADDGPGLAPEVRDRAFDRFVRGDSTRADGTGSSGLGLPIVAALVAAHHASVRLVSDPDHPGTQVTVTLPTHELSTVR